MSRYRTGPAILMLVILALGHTGCETTHSDDAGQLRLPARFSAPTMLPGVTDPSLGLIVDADQHPMVQSYAHRLAAGIATEIQLISGSTMIIPYTDLPSQAPMLVAAYETVRDPNQVSATGPLENLPPIAPPAMTLPPASDRLLVAQVIDLRPYVPMGMTLRLTVIDAHTQMIVGQTTALWDASTPTSSCQDPHCELHHLHCWQPECHPSPMQNSPDAMLKLVSQQVAAWYQQTLAQPVIVAPGEIVAE